MLDAATITALGGLGTALLAATTAVVAKLWDFLVASPQRQITELRAELKLEQKDHRKTLILLARLSKKYEPEPDGDSSPPQS